MRKIKIIGLTGQTGAGKSSVSTTISSNGLSVIDCDKLAHDILVEEKMCIADLAVIFGNGILNSNATLDRKKLGSIVFGDVRRLSKLNAVIFPYILGRIETAVKQLDQEKVAMVVLDAPTLFESGLDASCDYIASVTAPVSVRLNRIVIRDHLSDDEARKRISSQNNDNYYTKRSQYVLVNDGDLDDLRFKTLELIEDICRTFMKGSNNEAQ